MKTLIAALALTCLSMVAVADSSKDPVAVCIEEATTAQQQQDCCKKNKGVCGCRAGKIVCCDKTFADNCGC